MRYVIQLLLFLMAFSGSAQQMLSGKVKDAETGEALIGANLYLLSDFGIGAVTNFEGEFVLSVPDQYLQDSILVSYIGYAEQVLAITDVGSIISLDPRETEMMAVQVIAEPLIAEEFKFTRVNKIEVYTNPAAKADPLLAVNSMPASTTTDESASISLRGSSPIETGIFLNNVPVYDAVRYAQLNGIGTFSLFNTSLIQNVTVFPGNPPLEFGNSTSGVVSITTEDTDLEENSNSVIVSLANIGYQRNQKLGKINMKLFSNYQPSQLIMAFNPRALDQLDYFDSKDGGIYLYGNIGGSVSFKVYNYLLNEQYRYHFIHPSFIGNFDQNRLKGFNVTNLSWEAAGGTLSWNQGYSFANGHYDYSASDFEVLNRSIYQGLSYFRAAERYHIKFGLSLDARKMSIDGTFFQYPFALNHNHPTFQLADTNQAVTLEAFGYYKYYVSNSWILGAGLRKNLNQLNQRNYLSKQLNLTHIIDRQWKVIAGVGEYNKFGLYENSGELHTIKSKQASVDVFYNRPGLISSLSLFAKSNKTNGVDSEVVGFELFLDKQFWHKWSADLAYTYLSTTGQSPYDLSYFFKSNLSFKPGYWTISLNSVYRQGLTYNPISSVEYREDLEVYEPTISESSNRFEDYFILNLAVSRLFPISEDFTMVTFCSVNNAMNHQNIRGYSYDFDYSARTPELLSRRLIYFGAQVNF